MKSANRFDDEMLRLWVLLLAMIVAFVFLLSGMWKVQVVRADEFVTSEARQSIRRVRVPAPRGRLLDRNGALLAVSRPSYGLALYIEELRQPGRISNTVARAESVIQAIARAIGEPVRISREDIAAHVQRRRPLPLVAWRNLDQRAIARWAENPVAFPGVDVVIEPQRIYPEGSLACHVLGYVGRAEQPDDNPYHYYIPDMDGKAGVELLYNNRLSGVAGGRLLRVDASGFRHDEVGDREPVPGEDVMLTLDARIQRLAEIQMEGQRGACVVIDPRNGDVLAMASSPGYDAADLRDQERFAVLASDPLRPLFNRAVSAMYSPGSIFKPVVAIAALENRRISPDELVNCPGYFAVGRKTVFRCWRTIGHGDIGMRKAIEQSCNGYFCSLGIRIGNERIVHMAEALGLGRRTGIGLRGESAGFVPDDEWKRRVHHDAWRPGDTCNLSIGQGALLVTPLQMAVLAATLANGGLVYRPRLAVDPARPEGEIVNDMHWAASTLNVVRGGMMDVVNALQGTGARAAVPGMLVAGKTGTAEYGPRGEGRRKFTWMISFAPVQAPRYAIAIIIEDGISGGLTAAPRIHGIYEGIQKIEKGEVDHPSVEVSS